MTIAPVGAKRSLQVTAGAAVLLLVFLTGAASAPAAPQVDEAANHFRVVHSFAFGKGRHTGGARPRPLMQASDGNLYGVSYAGGAYDLGTVYRMKPGGSVVTVYSFQGSDGYGPEGTLIQASDGNLYGVWRHIFRRNGWQLPGGHGVPA
jgi:uncharacterized repeat protein (TIGR03803 family)